MPTAENENFRFYENPKERTREFRFNPGKFSNVGLREIAEYHVSQAQDNRSMFCVGQDDGTIAIPKIPKKTFDQLNRDQKKEVYSKYCRADAACAVCRYSGSTKKISYFFFTSCPPKALRSAETIRAANDF